MNEEISNQKETVSVSEKPKRPVLVTIFSVLMILGGVFSVLGGILFIVVGGLFGGFFGGILSILPASIQFISGFFAIVIGNGLRNMKRWTIKPLIVITALQFLYIIYSFLKNSVNAEDLLAVGLNTVILIYLLSIRDKFVS